MIVVNLDKLLSERKMQSAELAKQLGVTVQTVSRIKTGKVRAIRFSTLNALCEQLRCQPGDVLEYITEADAAQRYGQPFVEEYNRYHS